MTGIDHGPGLTWLAERAGKDPDALLNDRAELLRTLADAGRDAIELAARLDSKDPSIRAAAQTEANRVRGRFAVASDVTPTQRLMRRVTAALRAQTERLRTDGADPDGG